MENTLLKFRYRSLSIPWLLLAGLNLPVFCRGTASAWRLGVSFVLLLPIVVSCSAPPPIKDFGAASAASLQVTRGSAALRTLPGAPQGRTWIYQLSMPFQVAKGKAALFWGIREGQAKGADFEVGVDVVVFEDLAAISAEGAVPVTRNHSEPNPNTEPPGTPAIMVKYPVRGGFQPLGAKAPDGSPLPHAGTGFGMNQAIAWPSGEPEGPPPYRVNYFRGSEGYQYLEVHQFSYDGQEFRVEKTERVSLTGMLEGWAVLDGAMTNAIPDGEDFLIGVRAEPWDSAKSGRHPWSSPKSGTAVMRWRREEGRWRPVSIVPVAGPNQSFEPSLIRDVDGSLLFCARGGPETDYNDIQIWQSRDGGGEWKKIIHVRGLVSSAPITLNQAADGTPYVAANLYEVFTHPGRQMAIYRDSRGRVRGGGWTRKTLMLWPLNDQRTGIEEPILVRDCRADFGRPPGGSVWVADHPSGMTVHLADGNWHHVLAYRVLELAELSHATEPAPQTGGYIEEQ